MLKPVIIRSGIRMGSMVQTTKNNVPNIKMTTNTTRPNTTKNNLISAPTIRIIVLTIIADAIFSMSKPFLADSLIRFHGEKRVVINSVIEKKL